MEKSKREFLFCCNMVGAKEIYNMQALYGYHEWKLCPKHISLASYGMQEKKGLTLSAFEWEKDRKNADIWAGRLYVWRSTL